MLLFSNELVNSFYQIATPEAQTPMPDLAFSTFLKLLELPKHEKAATLRGFKRGGGFQYWRPMEVLAPKVAAGSLDLSDIQEVVGKMAKGHQRKYNEHALTNLLKWSIRRKISLRKKPEKIVIKFGKTGLHVRIEPQLAFSMDGRNYLMHIWATNNPTLSEETFSMGLFFFRNHLRKEGYENWQFLVFDTVKDRIFSEINMLASAAHLLAKERDILSELWAEIDRPSISPRREEMPATKLPEQRPEIS